MKAHSTLFLLMIAAAFPAVATGTLQVADFDFAGQLGSEGASVAETGPNHFQMALGHAPNHVDWPNKVQFTLRNAKGKALCLDVIFPAGGKAYRMNEYFCSWSYDGVNWHPVHWQDGTDKAATADTLQFPRFEQDVVYVGHQAPMSYETMRALVDAWARHPAVKVSVIGQSIGGRDVIRLTISDPASKEQKWCHYFANQHPGEHNAQWRMAGMIDWLLSDEGADCRRRMICHFVPMMSPDAPSKGWYRVNAEGVDMNRSYCPSGSDEKTQAHEAYVCQRDLEMLMNGPLFPVSVWSMHTWQGRVEPIILCGREMRERLSWEKLRDLLEQFDSDDLIKPLTVGELKDADTLQWYAGPHVQFGVTGVLCEGAGDIDTIQKNRESGETLIKAISEYYR
jgi:hypothetical protein